MLLKRATKKLAEAGKPELEIHKCLWGYTVHHKQYTSQRSHVFETPEEAIEGAIAGIAPIVLAGLQNGRVKEVIR